MTATLDRRADYVSAVAVELGDLAADDRAELIEELDDHVAALLEDRPEVDLVAELGTPRAYAAELRTAAGLDGAAAAGPRRLLADVVRGTQARVVAAAPWLPGVLNVLRPGWWVVRGVVAAFVVDVVLGVTVRSAEGYLLLTAGVVASLFVGQRLQSTRRARLVVVGVNVVAVLALLWLAVWSTPFAGASDVSTVYDTQYVPNCPIELDNLYAYDASGKPLDSVRLFDQNGTPFDLSQFNCNVSGQYSPGPGGTNAYPWPTASYGEDLAPTGPPSSLAPLPGATVPSGTPSATPSATPGATGTP